MSDVSGRATLVVGASRGLGRGIARAFAEAGAPVVAVARTGPALAELASTDAADATVAGSLLDRHEPEAVILAAGASPLMRPLQHQTWETFSVNWHTDVRIAFHWLREALLKPLRPASTVVVVSSGAAVAGSPLSGGYAGAKATQRFMTGYAQAEANRAGLGITFTEVVARCAEDRQDGELVRVAAYAGLRRGGLVALRWRDADFVRRKIVVSRAVSAKVDTKSTKSRRAREVPLPDQAAGALDRLSQRGDFTSPDDYVLVNRLGRRLDGSAVRRRLERARDATRLRPMRFHDLRHPYGSLLVAGGIDLASVKAATGTRVSRQLSAPVEYSPPSAG